MINPQEVLRNATLPIHIDSTILTTYRACPHRFWWEYILRLRPKLINIHFHAGGCFAGALEAWREAFYMRKLPEKEAQLVAVYTFIRLWKDVQAPPESTKSFFRVLAALVSYMETYSLATDHLQPLRPNTFEYAFAIPTKVIHPVSGDPFMFCGRIDLLALFRGLPAVVDEKTTTSLGSSFASKWKMRGQFLGYLWAVRQSLGIKANTAIVRGTGILKTQINHLEVPQTYPDFLIDEWEDELTATLQRMVHDWNAGRFPKNFGDACASFSTCNYTDLCTSKKPEIWFSDFGVNEWNPLLRNPIEHSEEIISDLTVNAALALAGQKAEPHPM